MKVKNLDKLNKIEILDIVKALRNELVTREYKSNTENEDYEYLIIDHVNDMIIDCIKIK